jgi:hypothetical protein
VFVKKYEGKEIRTAASNNQKSQSKKLPNRKPDRSPAFFVAPHLDKFPKTCGAEDLHTRTKETGFFTESGGSNASFRKKTRFLSPIDTPRSEDAGILKDKHWGMNPPKV